MRPLEQPDHRVSEVWAWSTVSSSCGHPSLKTLTMRIATLALAQRWNGYVLFGLLAILNAFLFTLGQGSRTRVSVCIVCFQHACIRLGLNLVH